MRKILSLMLAIVMVAMVFATIPFSVFAADETTTPTESPDDIVMKVYIDEGETKTLAEEIKRSAIGNYGENNMIGANITSTGKSVYVEILMPFEASKQIAFRAAKNGTVITIDGNNHLITSVQDDGGRNWGFFGNDSNYADSGKIVVNNLNFKNLDKSSSIAQIYRGATVDLVDCTLDGSAKHQGFWLTNQSNLNLLGTTVVSAGGHPIRCSGGAVENLFIDTNASLVAEGDAAALLVNGNAAHTIDIKGTITGKNAIDCSIAAATINVEGATIIGAVKATAGKLNLNSGAIFGTLEAADGVVTKAEGFTVAESAAAMIGNTPYATLDDAFAAAAAATEDVTVKVLADAAMTKQINPKHAFNVTIEGVPTNGVNPKITIASDAIKTNKFRFEGGADYALKNLTIVNENATGCLIQLNHGTNGGDIVIENCDITSADQYCMINCLATSGVDQVITIKDSKLTHTAAQSGNAIITSGNAGSQKMNMIVNIENSTLTATQKAIWVNKASTGQINLKATTFIGGNNAIIDLANPEDLTGASATVGKTTLTADGLTVFQPKEGQDAVKYDATNANISVNIESELPETVIAQIIDANGAVKATLTDMANLATFMASAVDGDTVKLYKDVNAGATQVWFYGDVTLDGNGKTWTYTGTDYAICGANADKNTGYSLGLTLEQMSTLTIKNLKLNALSDTTNPGGFKFYSSILCFEEGNEFSSKNILVLDARRAGKIIVNGGSYNGLGTLFSTGADYNETTPSTTTVEINDGTFCGKRILDVAGSKADPTANTFVINGGTFTAPADATELKFMSIKNIQLLVNGGTFAISPAQGNVFQVREGATTKVVIDGATINGNFLVEAGTVEFKTGTLDGNLTVNDGATATKAEGFNHINTAALPEVYYKEGTGEIEELTFKTALERAGASFDDVTITLNKNVTLDAATVIAAADIKVTIKGQGNTITLGTGIGNAFQLTGNGLTLAFENLTLTGDCGNNNSVSACVFQMKGVNTVLDLNEVNMIDLAAKWYIINIMGNDGLTRTVNINNCTAKNVPTSFISTGNANGGVGQDHSNYAVITIKNSNLENAQRILQVNAGSTANVLIENSTLAITTAGDYSIIRLYEIKNLHGADVMPQATRVVIRDTEFVLPENEQNKDIKLDANTAGYTIIRETPDDVVAKVVLEDGTELLDITRAEFTTKFLNGGGDNLTTTALKGQNYTIKILTDIDVGDAQLGFTVAANQTITIDGDPMGTGINATITGKQNANPIFRIHGADGVVTFKNLVYTNTSTLMQVYTAAATINLDNCQWTSTARGIAVNGGSASTINVNAGTVLTSTGAAVLFTDWGWTNCTVNVAEGASLVGTTLVSNHANTTGMKLIVDGGLLVGSITAEDGMFFFNTGKMEGDFIVPEVDGLKFFLGTGVVGDDFVITGINDLADEGGETTTEPPVTNPPVTVPGSDTNAPTTDTDPIDPPTTDTDPIDPPTSDTTGDTDPVGTPGDTTPDASTPADTKPADTEKPAGGGCGGFTVVATFLALICGAGAALVIKKK